MKITYPDFYNDFQCIASACTDSCCIGWEVDIDPFTMSIYESVDGSFGDRLRHSIAHDDCDHFILESECCPFLNKDNLCDIFINLGEDKLCDICTEHPRFYEWFGSRTEKGLGLCCEEVCRLLFSKKDKLKLVTIDTDEEDENPDVDEVVLQRLTEEREKLISLIQNRELSLTDRLREVFHSKDRHTDPYKALKEILDLYLSLESIDIKWKDRLTYAMEHISDLLEISSDNLDSRDYEHFLVYLIYRYYLKSVFDGDVWEKLAFASGGLIALRMADLAVLHSSGRFTFDDRITNAKGFSKDVEYSAENLDIVTSGAGSCLTSDKVKAVIELLNI